MNTNALLPVNYYQYVSVVSVTPPSERQDRLKTRPSKDEGSI